MLGGFVLLYREFGLPSKKGNCHINTRKSIHTRRRSPSLSECCLTIAIISCNQPKRSCSGIILLKSFAQEQSLVDDGKILYESSIIVEYLSDQYDLGLVPKDPYERARGKIVIDVIDKKIIPAYFRAMQAQEPDKQASAKEEFTAGLKEFAQHLPKNDGPFYGGKTFGFVDIQLVPWVLRYCLPWIVRLRSIGSIF